MRVPLLIVCAVLMAAGSGQAAIFGTWSTEDAGGGMDRLILTVTPTAGEIMAGFDIAIYDPTYGGNFQITTPLFNATRDLGSSFLLNKSHTLPGTPPVKVTDLLVTNELQDTYVIGGAFATTGGPGAYAAGWSGPLQLAEIIVPRGSFTNPMTQLIVTQSDLTGMPMISRPDGSLIHFGPMQPLIVTWTGGSNSTWDSWHWGNWKTTDGGAPT